MRYLTEKILASPVLDPADVYYLNVSLGMPMIILLDFTDTVLELPMRPAHRQARLVSLFSALCAVRAAQIADYDTYPGPLAEEQFSDFSLAFQTDAGQSCPRLFLEDYWQAQAEGVALNFVDLLVGQLCKEYLLIEGGGAPSEAGIIHSLHLCGAPRYDNLVRQIDHLLYSAGIPLATERYIRKAESGDEEVWTSLEEGALSVGGQILSYEDQQAFLKVRSEPLEVPVETGTLLLPPYTYSIHLTQEPD